MTPEEKSRRLLEISVETLGLVRTRLNGKFKRVLVVRPTGFGKSYLLAGLTSTTNKDGSLRYNKCLYIYPTDVIKEDVIRTYGSDKKFRESCKAYGWKNNTRQSDERAGLLNDNTDFYSYSYLTNRANDVKNGDMTRLAFRNFIKQYDLVMLDECDRVGADGFQDAFEIFETCISSDTHLVGVTATPNRFDETSILSVFGERNQIPRYTLKDAIKEGLLSKFDYIYAPMDNSSYMESCLETLDNIRHKSGDGKVSYNEVEEIRQRIHSVANMPDILSRHLKLPLENGGYEEHVGDSNYAKMVVFMNDRNQIHEQADIVAGWFKQAYPSMDVVSHVIITKIKNDTPYVIQGETIEIDDTESLDKIEPTDNRIDIIFCVDKLSRGYHVENITGVILMGNTESGAKYNQQIGRCFSVRSNTKPIIIDVVQTFDLSPSVQKWEQFRNSDYNQGRKVLLPDLLDGSCVDSYDYTEKVSELAKKLSTQDFDRKDTIQWLYTNRHMGCTEVAQSLGIKLDTVVKVLFNSGTDIVDADKILEHKNLLSPELLDRLDNYAVKSN